MTDKDPLEDFFETARRTPTEPSEALVSRVLADAQSEAGRRAVATTTPASRGWRAVLEGLGGWPALVGLGTATMAGLWIGFVQPVGVDPFALVNIGFDEGSLSMGYGDLDWGDG